MEEPIINDIYPLINVETMPNINMIDDDFLNDDNIRNEVKLWIETGHSRFGHISDWDVCKVTNMEELFKGYKFFNEPLENWNVKNVTNMSGMFMNCYNFNQPLENWNLENVINMGENVYRLYKKQNNCSLC